MAWNHHDGVVAILVAGLRRVTTDEERPLDCRSRRGASDHATTSQQRLDFALDGRAEIRVDETPLASTLDPDTRGMTQRFNKGILVGALRVACMQHSHLRYAKVLRETGLRRFQVDLLVAAGRRNDDKVGICTPGQCDKALLDLDRQGPAANNDKVAFLRA